MGRYDTLEVYLGKRYFSMIKSFRCKQTENLYNRKFVKKFSGIERQAIKRLRILDSAPALGALAALPSNRFKGAVHRFGHLLDLSFRGTRNLASTEEIPRSSE